MKKLFLLLPALAIIIAGCGAYQTGQNTNQPAVNQNLNQPADQTGLNAAVKISNFSFSPKTLTVKPGTTVTWTNQDGVGHDVKSADFASPILKKGESFSFQFNNPGAYNYYCAIHPSMTGALIVE